MNLGDKANVLCGDGVRRTGTAIYISPHFITYEFEGKGGNYNEAIAINQAATDKRREKKGKKNNNYTADEDAEILAAKDLTKVAKKQGRTLEAVKRHRLILKGKRKEGV